MQLNTMALPLPVKFIDLELINVDELKIICFTLQT